MLSYTKQCTSCVFAFFASGKEDRLAEVWDSMHNRISASELQEKYDFDFWLVLEDRSLDYALKYNKDYKLWLYEDEYKVYEYIKSD